MRPELGGQKLVYLSRNFFARSYVYHSIRMCQQLIVAALLLVAGLPAEAMLRIHERGRRLEIWDTIEYRFKNPFGQGDIVIRCPNLRSSLVAPVAPGV